MNAFFKIFWREWRQFRYNRVAVLIFVGAPVLYGLLIGLVYRRATVAELPVVVVDLDRTPLSQQLIEALDDNQYVHVAQVLHQTTELRQQVVQNNWHAVVTLPDRFEADIQQKRNPEIDVEVNASNLLTANYVSTGIHTTLAAINLGIEIETLKKKGLPTGVAYSQAESFSIHITRLFNPSSNYLMFLWPGMLGTVLQQVFLLALALSFAVEWERATLGELLQLSRSPLTLLLAKASPYWLMGMLLWMPLTLGLFYLFRLPIGTELTMHFAVSGLFVLALTFMGVGTSIFFDNQLKSTEILMVVATPSFIISGQTWPMEQMPTWVQHVAQLIPLTHYLEAFRRMLLMDAKLADIQPQVLAMAVLALGFFALAYVLLWAKLRRWRIAVNAA